MPRLSRYYFEGQFAQFADIISGCASSEIELQPGDNMNSFGGPLDKVFYIQSGIFKIIKENFPEVIKAYDALWE